MDRPLLSIVIPTLNREKELNDCLKSLNSQAQQAIETIILTERGPLAALRNQGWRQARAPVVSFLDDDVVTAPSWLRGVLDAFQRRGVVGVSGPSPVPERFQSNRDIYRYRHIRKVYDALFVGLETKPGHLTMAGTFVPDPDYIYSGFVQFLEACNMSFRKEALEAVGGFDEAYGGIGDWSEPDLCLRLRQRFGVASLLFNQQVRVEHHPSRAGAYLLRRPNAQQRLANYRLFAKRWVTSSWQHILYQGFLWGYYSWQSRCPIV